MLFRLFLIRRLFRLLSVCMQGRNQTFPWRSVQRLLFHCLFSGFHRHFLSLKL